MRVFSMSSRGAGWVLMVLALVAGFLALPSSAPAKVRAFGYGADPQVVLGKGHIGGHHWEFATTYGDGRGGKGCLIIASFDRRPLIASLNSVCAFGLSPRRGQVLTEHERSYREGRKPALTAVGMAFDHSITSVRVTNFDGTSETIQPLLIAKDVANRAGLDRFQFFSFAMRGPWCATELDTYDAAGEIRWEDDVESEAEPEGRPIGC